MEFDGKVMFSVFLSVHRGGGSLLFRILPPGVPLICLGGGPIVQNFATSCPTDLLGGGGVPKFFFFQNFFLGCHFCWGGGFPKFIYFQNFFFQCHFQCHFRWGGGRSQKLFFFRIFFFRCHFRCHFWGGGGQKIGLKKSVKNFFLFFFEIFFFNG